MFMINMKYIHILLHRNQYIKKGSIINVGVRQTLPSALPRFFIKKMDIITYIPYNQSDQTR